MFAVGTYPARIGRQAFDEGQYGCQFVLTIVVSDGEREQERSVFLSLTDEKGEKSQYADKTIEVLKYLGFSGSLAQLDPRHPQHVSLAGIDVTAYCAHKAKEDGTVKERWYINVPRVGMETKSPEKSTFRKLDALFGKALKSNGTQQAKPPAAREAPKPVHEMTPEEVAAEVGDQEDEMF
jgi:hypothetical protein